MERRKETIYSKHESLASLAKIKHRPISFPTPQENIVRGTGETRSPMRKVTSDYGLTIILFRGMGFLKECICPASMVSLIRTSRILHIGTLNDLLKSKG